MVCVMLVTACAVYTAFMVQKAAVFSARQHYRVYDDIEGARARWLLPLKTNPDVLQPSQSAELKVSLNSLGLSLPSSSRTPGRYLLPDDPAGTADWEALAEVLVNTDGLSRMWTIYGMIQAMTLVLLFGRLLSTLAFQGRVGIMVRTLFNAVPAVLHLVIILLLIAVMFSVMEVCQLGIHVEEMSNLDGALSDTLGLLVGRSILRNLDTIVPRNMEFTTVQAHTYGAPHLAIHPVTSKDFYLRVPYTSPGVTVFGVSDLLPKTFDALRRACSENEQTLDSGKAYLDLEGVRQMLETAVRRATADDPTAVTSSRIAAAIAEATESGAATTWAESPDPGSDSTTAIGITTSRDGGGGEHCGEGNTARNGQKSERGGTGPSFGSNTGGSNANSDCNDSRGRGCWGVLKADKYGCWPNRGSGGSGTGNGGFWSARSSGDAEEAACWEDRQGGDKPNRSGVQTRGQGKRGSESQNLSHTHLHGQRRLRKWQTAQGAASALPSSASVSRSSRGRLELNQLIISFSSHRLNRSQVSNNDWMLGDEQLNKMCGLIAQRILDYQGHRRFEYLGHSRFGREGGREFTCSKYRPVPIGKPVVMTPVVRFNPTLDTDANTSGRVTSVSSNVASGGTRSRIVQRRVLWSSGPSAPVGQLVGQRYSLTARSPSKARASDKLLGLSSACSSSGSVLIRQGGGGDGSEADFSEAHSTITNDVAASIVISNGSDIGTGADGTPTTTMMEEDDVSELAIYAALWESIHAMEYWQAGVVRWQSHVWLQQQQMQQRSLPPFWQLVDGIMHRWSGIRCRLVRFMRPEALSASQACPHNCLTASGGLIACMFACGMSRRLSGIY
ncbi:hypothetical protein VOLCADRAFT_93125 [Volvox carteri f. nagariensis]|uniref:Polycystin cation channel PKD1/PKD2 domain-containing protein n=1 Tax=Volvox carteri f. nagariensis TaxID=3068 RepID=D8U1D7_VOLCA|nr:uncharacterized protein VOLCADRAFT_93125 [Volvox carteri f. nagariensis]EFJ46537.1 hypothetical protein VOLCADRAFT_93125 [Volvox carteri f. nagariensis]|eukprot:XP_002952394.1 hypothetical protein VOLCADRAFT_93125 [Volvox carteri f. nagariensis]